MVCVVVSMVGLNWRVLRFKLLSFRLLGRFFWVMGVFWLCMGWVDSRGFWFYGLGGYVCVYLSWWGLVDFLLL